MIETRSSLKALALAVTLLHCGRPEQEANPSGTDRSEGPSRAPADSASPAATAPDPDPTPQRPDTPLPTSQGPQQPGAASSESSIPANPVRRDPSEPSSGSGDDSGDAATAPSPAAGERCALSSTLTAGDQTLSLEHDGVARTYLVHVPRDLEPGAAVPLVVDMHGLTSSASQQAGLSGWRRKADQEGFIVAHPQGLDASWNGGDLCCGTSQSQGVDDEGFIRAMVTRLEQDACIDSHRVYATGLSNGGAMSHLLACNAADVFAASAPVSMGNGTRPCAPSRPISVVMTRGTRDNLVSFDGGLFPSAQQDFEQWAELDGCRGEPESADELCEVYTNCDGGVEVKLCAVDAGHVLYDNAQDFSVPDVVWETFERQRLP
jgi:polyhydroxybutyrate depolymerase